MPRIPDAPSGDLLYRSVAAGYRQAIAQGALPAGSRMPSVRALMQRHGTSLSTALHALRLLEDEGLLEARPRRGYFVRHADTDRLPGAREPEALVPLAPDPDDFVGINRRISVILDKARRASPLRVDLGSAMPAPELFDAPALNRLAMALLREQPDILVRGPSAPSTHPEFQAAMARHAVGFGLHVAPAEVLATSGNSEAVNLALEAVAEPGDLVAVESPTFFGLLQAIEARGLQALEIPCSPTTGISIEALDLAVRSHPRLRAVVAVPHLQMPLGSVMPDAHKRRLVEFCAEHGLALVEDDIYREFVESTRPLRPMKAWDAGGQVIYCASLSKSFAPGLRQGWMNGGRWHARIQMLKFARTRNMQSWSQLLAARSVLSPEYERHLQRLRTRLQDQRAQAARAILRHFPAGTRLSLPPGGLSLWLEMPPGVSTLRLFDQALARGIRIAPGAMFSNTGRYDRFVRLSCGLPFTEAVEDAYRELGLLAARMLEAAPADPATVPRRA
ncbi:MAG: PLP-dependent aminotransferase family protein [Xylophilus ampelinus]